MARNCGRRTKGNGRGSRSRWALAGSRFPHEETEGDRSEVRLSVLGTYAGIRYSCEGGVAHTRRSRRLVRGEDDGDYSDRRNEKRQSKDIGAPRLLTDDVCYPCLSVCTGGSVDICVHLRASCSCTHIGVWDFGFISCYPIIPLAFELQSSYHSHQLLISLA